MPLVAPTTQSAQYIEQRWSPSPGDASYLHLSDLRLALGRFGSTEALRVLDYGCGGSPYRRLFPNADFRRADIEGVNDVDYYLDDDDTVPERSEFFDLVLSTQVLEHVAQPQVYLREAHRLLRPGGRFICTTHGTFPDHACPRDYRRWTYDGLAAELRDAGFDQADVLKVTTGPRAVFFLMEEIGADFAVSRRTFFGAALWVLRSLVQSRRRSLHTLLDRHFAACRVVSQQPELQRFYIGLIGVSRRPPGP